MKKFIILVVAILTMGMQTITAQIAKVMLHHNGKATLFESTEVQKAIDASVDGDTIYIGQGPYNDSSLSINKRITIMGQGVGSLLGDVTIDLPGGSEMSSTILYGINAGSVTINSSVSNLHIDKCTFTNLTIIPNSTTTTKTFSMKDMVIERCEVSNRFITTIADQFENAIIRNCKIKYFSNGSKDVSFINCYLQSTYAFKSNYLNEARTDYVYGTLINCIIASFETGKSTYYGGCIIDNSATFVNCLCGVSPSSGTITDCYMDSKTDYTDEELTVKAYLGTDGTIVGPNGGIRPFNLVPAVPSLEDIKMGVNYNTKKLNVTIKVKAN